MENLWPYLEVLAPSVGVALIFWFAMRAIFRADRNERAAESRIRQEYAAAEAQQPGTADSRPEAQSTSSAEAESQRPAP